MTQIVGAARAGIGGRTMAVDANGSTAYAISTSEHYSTHARIGNGSSANRDARGSESGELSDRGGAEYFVVDLRDAPRHDGDGVGDTVTRGTRRRVRYALECDGARGASVVRHHARTDQCADPAGIAGRQLSTGGPIRRKTDRERVAGFDSIEVRARGARRSAIQTDAHFPFGRPARDQGQQGPARRAAGDVRPRPGSDNRRHRPGRAPSPSSPLAESAPLEVFFGDPSWKQAGIIVDWSGLTPGFVGLIRSTFACPASISAAARCP